jgi:hypothetical protein
MFLAELDDFAEAQRAAEITMVLTRRSQGPWSR